MSHRVQVASVILNESSGSLASEKLRPDIERAFSREDVRIQWLPLNRRSLSNSRNRALEKLLMQAEGAVCVAGGDGTVNAVASACRRLGRPLGILPAGTFNYVARNLGLPLDMIEAAKIVASGYTAPIQAGDINGHIFLNNAGFGLYSQMIERREYAKRRFGRHRIIAFASGIRCLMERHPVHRVHITADGTEQSLRTTTMFFGVNALQLQNYNVDAAKHVERGHLAVLSLRLNSRFDIAAMAWAALHGKVEAADCVDGTAANSVRVTTRRHKLKVAIDGEIVVLHTPLMVRVVHDALSVYVPEPQPEEADIERPREEAVPELAHS